MERFAQTLQSTLGETVPHILGAVLIFIIGWFVAVLAKAAVRKVLNFAGLNERIGSKTKSEIDVEGGVATGAFWVLILITLVAVFNTLNLELVSEPLNALVNKIFAYAPQLVAGGVLLLVAWILAGVVRLIVTNALSATTLDEKLAAEAGMTSISENLGTVLFWLVILLFLPAILGAFQLQGLLEPVQALVDEMLAMVPNIFAAAVIGFVGWLVARIVRDITSNLLAAAGADKLGVQLGIKHDVSLSGIVGTIVFIFVFIPALIAALNALQVEAISKPATDMLGIMLAAVPNILSAAIILTITYFVARFAADLLVSLLAGLGFDSIPEKLGLKAVVSENTQLSALVGTIFIFFAMLFAAVEASNKLGFTQVRDVVTMFIQFGGQILLGSVILAVGLWLANLAHKTIVQVSGTTGMAGVARIAILGLVTAMGLRAMGIADDVVNLAFGLTLGSVAIAVALSFGLGGREAAGVQMEYWLSSLRKE